MEMGAASYWIAAEGKAPFGGREVFCIVRDTDCITSCCGMSQGFRSVGVPGYVVEWRTRMEEGLPVSVVEPIIDGTERAEIARLLQERYRVSQVEFL
ncbi:MAG: hypothetical protein C4532_01850 [Candidatus Abyssobacteria bacterium SURF_17]|uniref:Uncharacterized protein n=1 Tax=Candidatus Abyssobacteria bacterium SURF_17 TaxID=2093361 RepID=A0A419F837_9BACT|nr:MAG: hypothetical protein C4532_01850 [Candidatus Abyssubacteria bacterium SURF_17]